MVFLQTDCKHDHELSTLHGIIIHCYVGVDQKVLARSYVFGDHSSWLKSLRERSAMEFAKETYFFAKDSALNSWRPACALAYLQTPLPCREGDTQHLHLHY